VIGRPQLTRREARRVCVPGQPPAQGGRRADDGGSHRLLASFTALAVGALASQVLGFIGIAIVARHLAPQELGAYAFATNLSSYFALPLMAGVAVVGIREVAASVDSRPRTVAEVQIFVLTNGVVAYALLFILTPLLSSDPLTRTLLRVTGLALIINAVGLDWAMQGLQRLRLLSLFRFLGQAIYLPVLLIVLVGGAQGAVRYALCNLLGLAVTGALTVTYVWRSVGFRSIYTSLDYRSVPRVVRARASRSFAPAIGLVMVTLYYSVDVVVLGYIGTEHDVGEYTVASRLPIALTTFASLWVTTFYPHAAVLFRYDRERLKDQVDRFATLSVVVAAPCVPVGLVLGRHIMATMFGATYSPGGIAFGILLSAAGAALVNANVGQILLACGDDRGFMWSVSAGAVVNLALNFMLIPPFGIEGSALATLIAELCVIAAAGRRIAPKLGRIRLDGERLARSCIALGALAGTLIAMRAVAPWWVTLVVSGVVYCALLGATRAITVAELRQVGRA
jgi:O-antigen/teichoic acid export membrane protein